MNPKTDRLTLEIYGMSRVVLGVAQLVGLSAGFFLTEWIIQYPQHFTHYVIDEDIVVVTYLAIILRSLFHICCGIGIARVKEWARYFIIFAWPLMMIITGGLIYSIVQEWIVKNFVADVVQVIHWPKLGLYLGMVAFDYTFVNMKLLRLLRGDSSNDVQPSMAIKTIGMVVFGTVLFFSLLLYFGKPIKQGFHKGYYKTKGVVHKEGKSEIVLKQKEIDLSEATNQALSQKKKVANQSTVKQADRVGKLTDTTRQNIKKTEDQDATSHKVLGKKQVDTQHGIPYIMIMGYLGGFSIILGFLFQLMNLDERNQVSLSGLTFLCIGFFLWVVYAVSSKISIVSLTSFISLVLCLSILIKQKLNN